jgi:hypothetical protein
MRRRPEPRARRFRARRSGAEAPPRPAGFSSGIVVGRVGFPSPSGVSSSASSAPNPLLELGHCRLPRGQFGLQPRLLALQIGDPRALAHHQHHQFLATRTVQIERGGHPGSLAHRGYSEQIPRHPATLTSPKCGILFGTGGVV